jgi:2-oxoglutarate ferredoxin oxidoreductase subunit gamma
MREEFLFAGFGGQGVMFAGQLLAYAAMEARLEVTWIPSYGPEMRGGTAHCFTVISDKPIGSPVSKHPQVAVVFNNPSFEKYEPVVAHCGLLAYNASIINLTSQRDDLTTLAVPAAEMAEKIGDKRLMNVVLLGAVLAVRPVVSLKNVSTALNKHVPEHHRDLLEMNLKALDEGAAFATAKGTI